MTRSKARSEYTAAYTSTSAGASRRIAGGGSPREADEPERERGHDCEAEAVAGEQKRHVEPRRLGGDRVADPRKERRPPREEQPEEDEAHGDEARERLGQPVEACST